MIAGASPKDADLPSGTSIVWFAFFMANRIADRRRRIVSKLSQFCLKNVSWNCRWKLAGPPARSASIQWLDRPRGVPPSSGWTAREEFHFPAGGPGPPGPPRPPGNGKPCCRSWPLARAKAMLPLPATGPCEAREPILGAKHLPGTIPEVSVVPVVPVAGASPAKRPGAYSGHWPGAYSSHRPAPAGD